MNYRHAFHAGNFADVVKHIILCLIITYLQKKPAPFRVIDTHAGPGLYDLTSDAANRSPEWREGIARLVAADLPGPAAELVAPYLDAVMAHNPDGALNTYPGSPKLARSLLRPLDRLTALELHPEDAAALKALFAGDVAVKAIELDGWQALPAHLPPKEKRGLILIDPPFEQEDEFERLAATLVKACRPFPTGVYALWYPLKDEKRAAAFKRQLYKTGLNKMLCAEFWLRAPSTPPRLYGTGMIVLNPPFTLENDLKTVFKALVPVLTEARTAGYTVDWIRGE